MITAAGCAAREVAQELLSGCQPAFDPIAELFQPPGALPAFSFVPVDEPHQGRAHQAGGGAASSARSRRYRIRSRSPGDCP